MNSAAALVIGLFIFMVVGLISGLIAFNVGLVIWQWIDEHITIIREKKP